MKLAFFSFLLFISACATTDEDRLFRPISEINLTEIFKDTVAEAPKKEVPIEEKMEGEVTRKKVAVTPVQKAKTIRRETPGRKETKKAPPRSKHEIIVEKLTAKSDSDIESKYPEGYPEYFAKNNESYEKVWKMAKPNFREGETATYDIFYLGLTAGHFKLQVLPKKQVNGKEAYHFRGKLKSANYYDFIYSVNDVIESYVSTKSLLPLKHVMIQRESGQNVDDLQTFDYEKLQTQFLYYRDKKGKITKKNKLEFIPSRLQDSFSLLYFVRMLPMKIGDTYRFPIITRAKPWIVNIKVTKKEVLNVAGRKWKTIVVNAVTKFPGKLKQSGDITFWFEDSPQKTMLKFEAKVKVGSIGAELVSFD